MNNIRSVMLFCYDFPHKKTQDFLLRFLAEGYHVSYIIAAPKQKLNIAQSSVHIAPEHVGLIHPKLLCRRFNITYNVYDHNSKLAQLYIKKHPVDLSIISGARILSPDIINVMSGNVLNIHPGLLPEVRGLDTLLWSIYYDVAMGITGHLIGPKIDAGYLLYKERLHLQSDDTLIDISLRLLEKQTDTLMKSIKTLERNKRTSLKNLNMEHSRYNTKMPADLEEKTVRRFPSWLKKHMHHSSSL